MLETFKNNTSPIFISNNLKGVRSICMTYAAMSYRNYFFFRNAKDRIPTIKDHIANMRQKLAFLARFPVRERLEKMKLWGTNVPITIFI